MFSKLGLGWTWWCHSDVIIFQVLTQLCQSNGHRQLKVGKVILENVIDCWVSSRLSKTDHFGWYSAWNSTSKHRFCYLTTREWDWSIIYVSPELPSLPFTTKCKLTLISKLLIQTSPAASASSVNRDVSLVSLQHNIMLERRREGVKPDMPTAAERQERLTALGGKPY